METSMNNSNICSIYLLTNTINGKIYVGQTWLSLPSRMGGKNGSNYKHSVYLFNAIKKYGADKFEYTILAQCKDQESADCLEEDFINKYDSRNPDIGYNLKAGGSVGKHSEETKNKISNSLANKEWSEEALLAKAEGGRMSKDKKKPVRSEEQNQHHADAMKEWHATHDHPMKGQHLTEEARAKISEAHKGQVISEEHKKALLEANKMDPQREKDILQAYQSGSTIAEIEKQFNTGRSSVYRILKRNNISRERDHKHWTGKKHSAETLQKMAESRKNYWIEKNEQDK